MHRTQCSIPSLTTREAEIINRVLEVRYGRRRAALLYDFALERLRITPTHSFIGSGKEIAG